MRDEWDVIVIGAGAAGLSASVAAAEQGARVITFESESAIGGSLQLSAGMFTAAGTSVQRELGIDDSPARFFQHYMDLNQWILQPGLIWRFCQEAAVTFEWLLGLGIEVPAQRSTNAHMPGVCQAGVEDVWRGHVPAGEGFRLVEVLERARRDRGGDLVLHSRIEKLLHERGRVTGVVADGVEVRADAVVVATGGLARDPELVRRYFPAALAAGDSLFVVAGAGSRGDHIRFADQIDAGLAGTGRGLLLVTAYFQRHHHWQAGFPPKSRIHVNHRGLRFMDEDASYAVAAGILAAQGGPAWVVFDEAARRSLPPGYADWDSERVRGEVEAGRTQCADDIPGLAAAMAVPTATLKYTVDRWNQHLPHGDDPDFLRHRTLAAKGADEPPAPLAEPPFYAARLVPAELVVTHTGLQIDQHARVLDPAGQDIPGLYAAGEAGGGVLGTRYVGGGNAIANALTMGRLAGIGAARGC